MPAQTLNNQTLKKHSTPHSNLVKKISAESTQACVYLAPGQTNLKLGSGHAANGLSHRRLGLDGALGNNGEAKGGQPKAGGEGIKTKEGLALHCLDGISGLLAQDLPLRINPAPQP